MGVLKLVIIEIIGIRFCIRTLVPVMFPLQRIWT